MNDPAPWSVLIIDDEQDIREVTAMTLMDSGFIVETAADGIEGIAAIRAGKGELVFLDLNMPNLDGYGVLQVIAQEGLRCRVIVVSGDVQPEARARVMLAGAHDFGTLWISERHQGRSMGSLS